MSDTNRDLRVPKSTDCNEIAQLRKALSRATTALKSTIIQRDRYKDTLIMIRGEKLH